ncbi:MAG: bifunctional phosphoribosylaminoimidazolecarboxamide formyltransferase/IMP cyclohydrolase [Bacteroidota bacterium]
MNSNIKIKKALISVYHKEHLESIIRELIMLDIELITTGGTQNFIEMLGESVTTVEGLTTYPSILGGRVKTLHPKIFGGILGRRDNPSDIEQMQEFQIPSIDLVIVDLYPFEETVASGADEADVIEKIDIGGVSLIRAAAKNYKDVLVISSKDDYGFLLNVLKNQVGKTSIEDRKKMSAKAFAVTSHYDNAINDYLSGNNNSKSLRYGENPHQKGFFQGNLNEAFEQLNGKELSYNNLLDIDAAINLMADFSETTFAILKHNNACGLASRETVLQAYKDALAGDPVSAFGGILITNKPIDQNAAAEMNNLFFEVLIAPDFDDDGLEILKQKKNRIILKQNKFQFTDTLVRTAINGTLIQERDSKTETQEDMKTVTTHAPSKSQLSDMEFANKIVKHSKSNCIVLAKNNQLLASGVGQTSRVDALLQAIEKAKKFGFDLQGSVMASDAFFPFPDCTQIAADAGVKAIIQPGGSVKDNDSIDCCNKNNVAMVVTGTRHFKH